MKQSQETLENLENEADELDQVLSDFEENEEEEDQEDDEQDEIKAKPQVNRGGRPRGSTKAKKVQMQELQEDDPFQFVREYSAQHCQPVDLRIYKQGALLAIVNFANESSKIPFKSISDLQYKAGAGLYTFKAYSVTEGRKIFESKMQILDAPQSMNESNDIGDTFNNLLNNSFKDNGIKEQNQQSNQTQGYSSMAQNPINVHVPPQASASQLIKELISSIAPLIPLIKMLIPQKNESNEMTLMKMKMELEDKYDRKIEEERRRLREEREEMDRRINEKVQEKAETMGIAEPKSLVGEVVDGLKQFSSIVSTKARIASMQAPKAQVVKKNVQRKEIVQPVKKVDNAVVEIAPQAVVTPQVMSLNDIFQDIMTQVSNGVITEEAILEYVRSNSLLLQSVKSYPVEAISQHFESVLKSNGEGNNELIDYINGIIKSIYAKI